MKKRRYVTDLAGLQAQTEVNYLRLLQLVPNWEEFDELEFAIEANAGSGNAPVTAVSLRVLERNPYTTTLVLSQQGALLPWASSPQLTVRVYHDVRMAEVVSWNRHRNLKPKYQYPNQQMYVPDEKAQLNQFLGEWLGLCLQHGRALETIDLG